MVVFTPRPIPMSVSATDISEAIRTCSIVEISNINTRLGEAAKQSPNSVTVVWTRCFQLRGDETRQADNGCLTGTNILSKLL